MLTDLTELGQKMKKQIKDTQNEIKQNIQGTNSDRKEIRTESNNLKQKEEINCWELPCLVSEAVTHPWLRLSERPWDHKPLRRQSLSPWQGRHLCPLYFTLLGPEPDQLANDG